MSVREQQQYVELLICNRPLEAVSLCVKYHIDPIKLSDNLHKRHADAVQIVMSEYARVTGKAVSYSKGVSR